LSSESMLGHHKYDCYESPSASQLNQLWQLTCVDKLLSFWIHHELGFGGDMSSPSSERLCKQNSVDKIMYRNWLFEVIWFITGWKICRVIRLNESDDESMIQKVFSFKLCDGKIWMTHNVYLPRRVSSASLGRGHHVAGEQAASWGGGNDRFSLRLSLEIQLCSRQSIASALPLNKCAASRCWIGFSSPIVNRSCCFFRSKEGSPVV
jgi:hypothetical protein